MANVALKKPVLEKEPEVGQPQAATDGVTQGYTGSDGFARFNWPGTVTVDLESEYALTCFRMLLWDGKRGDGTNNDGRRYQYRLLTSLDGETWDHCYETDDAGGSGWQVIRAATPIRARYVRVEGLHNSSNEKFHLVELEAHDDEPPPLESEVALSVTVPVRTAAPSQAEPPRLPAAGYPLSPHMVLDAYRLIRRLGRGQSAEVWKAEVIEQPVGVDLELGQEVAVKVYLGMSSGFQPLRIQREFLASAAVKHPSVAKVYDVVISPSRPWHIFLVMELVEGQTLKEFASAKDSMTIRQILLIADQLFGAVEALHSMGIRHRDIKAANVMLLDRKETQIKLLDFGIVSVQHEPSWTMPSEFLGSKHTAPLEQLSGEELDDRSDIYSAGAVLYNLYTGRPPYYAAGPVGAIVRTMMRNPVRLELRNSQADSDEEKLVDIINRCLSVKKTDRPRSAQIVQKEVQRILSGG